MVDFSRFGTRSQAGLSPFTQRTVPVLARITTLSVVRRPF